MQRNKGRMMKQNYYRIGFENTQIALNDRHKKGIEATDSCLAGKIR